MAASWYAEEKAEIRTASKALVDELLGMNTHNRKFKAGWIKTLCKAAMGGSFSLTNQGIGVSRDGVLLDGQNRLMAIRDAGYPPVRFVLVTGLESSAQEKIDIGYRRTLADLLALLIDKPAVAQIKASSCNTIWRLNREVCPGDEQVHAISQFIDAYSKEIDEVISALGSKGRSGVVAALIEYAIYCGPSKAVDFCAQIKSGEGIFKRDPAYKVREFLAGRKGGGSAIIEGDRAYAISACVAFHEGKECTFIRPRSEWPDSLRKRGRME